MNDNHLTTFVREGEEQITELNEGLLALEADPTDREALDALFRTAHTVKGNFSAMGLTAAGALGHALEDLLDELREGRMTASADVMDQAFAGVDAIEAVFDAIEDDGVDAAIDVEDTVASIRALIATEIESDDPVDDGDEPSADLVDRALAAVDGDLSVGDDRTFHVEARLDDSTMQSVDGLLAVQAMRSAFDDVVTEPPLEAIEDGEFEDAFSAFVTGSDLEAVEETVAGIRHLTTATVTDVTDAIGSSSSPNPDADRGDSNDDASPDGIDDGRTVDTEATSEADQDGEMTELGTPAAEPDLDASEGSPAGNGSRSGEISSIRIDVERLDELHGMVEQLVTNRIKLRRSVDHGDVSNASDNVQELDKITTHLQDTVMDMRLIPLKQVVSTFPRMVRDLARSQEKEVQFELSGADVELDRLILTEIGDPLVHVLRNAVDHGIEPPDERESVGKSRSGRVELRARREQDHVVIEVEDDGRGLDADRLRESASEKGIHTPDELASMDDRDVYDLIFHPGFSTAESITDVSGRGVGMDVVHDTVRRLDGSVSVDSETGAGTTVRIRLPVTVAIVRVLFVEVCDREFGIPIKSVDEVYWGDTVRTVNGGDAIEHDDVIFPVIRLADALGVPGASETSDGMVVRISRSERQVALHCDRVQTHEEVVVKPLEGTLRGTRGLSGTTVLGDGNIVPILDVVAL